jgi:diadenosine tetraphosphatase ApaH/serine/threonine PP2A family protein phosphatase
LNRLFFLGDAVGYGADPNLVVEKIDEVCDIKMLGNHDAAAIGQLSPDYFNQYARTSFYFTQKVLKPENMERLTKFQLMEDWDRFTLVHALPKEPESWGYISTLREAEENFDYFENQICLIGHSHRPFVVQRKDNQEAVLISSQTVHLDVDCRYIINVGSVGQPRDGNPEACYIIYNDQTEEISFRRLKYDIATAQAKMKQARIPGYLVERLSVGR